MGLIMIVIEGYYGSSCLVWFVGGICCGALGVTSMLDSLVTKRVRFSLHEGDGHDRLASSSYRFLIIFICLLSPGM
jgi:hypothetical protein